MCKQKCSRCQQVSHTSKVCNNPPMELKNPNAKRKKIDVAQDNVDDQSY